ncbi:MAG: GlsB/YeaQ/YmgE family stress response membrane protein [Nocardioides sp.]|uniref:GlsB/YeaQ/YmgE family stress response membrane protein n=1 Tax=Nocardioides sp. TaxID=35761 RepID=UPI003EFD2F88
MLFIGIIAFGVLVGGLAQLLLGKSMQTVNWPLAVACGLLGSLLGGLLASLLSGDGLELRMSGLLGSFVGAVIVTGAWGYLQTRRGA